MKTFSHDKDATLVCQALCLLRYTPTKGFSSNVLESGEMKIGSSQTHTLAYLSFVVHHILKHQREVARDILWPFLCTSIECDIEETTTTINLEFV